MGGHQKAGGVCQQRDLLTARSPAAKFAIVPWAEEKQLARDRTGALPDDQLFGQQAVGILPNIACAGQVRPYPQHLIVDSPWTSLYIDKHIGDDGLDGRFP